jgi:hypothetical protein
VAIEAPQAGNASVASTRMYRTSARAGSPVTTAAPRKRSKHELRRGRTGEDTQRVQAWVQCAVVPSTTRVVREEHQTAPRSSRSPNRPGSHQTQGGPRPGK